MTPLDDTNARRADRLSEAISAAISGDVRPIEELFTPDVVGSGPALTVASRDELRNGIKAHRGSFVDVEIAFAPLDVGGRQAAVEWVASGRHTPPEGDDRVTAERIRVRAVTVAEFEVGRICSFRSYWDDLRHAPGRTGSRST